MAEMLKLDDGSLVPMTAVRLLRPRRNEGRFDVYDHDGERMGEALSSAVDEVRSAIVPAEAGWCILTFADEQEDEFYFDLEPVIAWRFRGGFPLPMTLHGEQTGSDWALVAPNGRTDIRFREAWDSLEEARMVLEERWEKARAKGTPA